MIDLIDSCIKAGIDPGSIDLGLMWDRLVWASLRDGLRDVLRDGSRDGSRDGLIAWDNDDYNDEEVEMMEEEESLLID